MYNLAEQTTADWQSAVDNHKPPDQHYQALLLRAISIILLNPWVDDDQTGRRLVFQGHDSGYYLVEAQTVTPALMAYSTSHSVMAIHRHLS